MTPEASIVHHLPGRTRFRVAAKRGDADYFSRLREQLGQCPGVLSVTTSAVTGSVLVIHEAADSDTLLSYARTFELFELAVENAGAVERVRSPAEILTHNLERMDRWVRTETRQTTDLRSLALTGLIGAAVWQALRGQVFPAAATLVWYAITVVSDRRHLRASENDVQASTSDTYDKVDSPAD
jgi:hypothetical protein